MPPAVSSGLHCHLISGPSHNEAVFYRITFFQSLVTIWFQSNCFSGSKHRIGSYQKGCFAVLNSILQADCRKTGKYNGMNSSDPGTGQYGDYQFGNHWQINSHPVAFLHTFLFQNIGAFTDFFMELLIGEGTDFFFRLPLPDQGNLILSSVFQMTVQTVVRNI